MLTHALFLNANVGGIQANVEVTFLGHVEVLKGFYCSPQPCGQTWGERKSVFIVVTIISPWDLDVQ